MLDPLSRDLVESHKGVVKLRLRLNLVIFPLAVILTYKGVFPFDSFSNIGRRSTENVSGLGMRFLFLGLTSFSNRMSNQVSRKKLPFKIRVQLDGFESNL